MAGCSDSATSWRLFDSNIDIFYWVQPIRRRRKMVTVAKATTLPRTRVRSVIAGASYFALLLIVIGFSAFAILHILHATFTSSDEAASILAAREISKHGIPFRSFGANLLQVTGRALSCLSILMIGDSELGWRGASLTAYCLLLLLPALILMRRGPKILGPAWALFVGLSPAILLSAFSARMYMVYMLFCTLAIVLSVFWRPMKWDRKGFLYLSTSLAASFSNEHFIVFAPSLEFTDGSVVVAGTRAAARFPRFPAIRYPGFSDRLRSSHTLRGPIFAALVPQRDFNACIPRLSAKLVVSDLSGEDQAGRTNLCR